MQSTARLRMCCPASRQARWLAPDIAATRQVAQDRLAQLTNEKVLHAQVEAQLAPNHLAHQHPRTAAKQGVKFGSPASFQQVRTSAGSWQVCFQRRVPQAQRPRHCGKHCP